MSGCSAYRKSPSPRSWRSAGGAWFLLPDGRGLHLGVEEPFQPARKAHPAFRAAALDALAERLGAAGFPVTWDDSVPGVRRFHSADPFGNRLEFQEAVPPEAGT